MLETTLLNQLNPLDVLKVIKDRIELIDSSAFYDDQVQLETTENLNESREGIDPKLTEDIKILIVDDNSDARFTIGEIVKSLGSKPEFAVDGFECLEKLQNNIPDLVLLDIMMPKMDGFKTISEIRKKNEFKNLKVYALTAYAMLSDKEIIEKNGFDGLLTKPINGLQLERKLNKLFNTIS